MDREILFRGKRKDNGKWIYGNLLVANDKVHYGETYILQSISDFSYGGTNRERCRVGCFIEVLQNTVGQFSGLNDKNENKIFENDIVKTPTGFYPVVFNGCAFWLYDKMLISNENLDFLGSYESTYIEVVGNIFDNLELLEEQDE